MLTMYSEEDSMDNPWSRFLGEDDFEDVEMNVDANDVEAAQMSPKDTYLYKSCPVWEELIFVRCRYCNCSILPHSIKNHIEMRHTGEIQYEKDPEFSIFRKKPSLPPALISTTTTPNPRASSSAVFGIPYSRTPTSCSGDAFSAANQSPRMAEQFLGWPNSPHGAFQHSPLNMTTGANIVRVKPENKAKIVIPGYSKARSGGVSVLAKNTPLRKDVQELSPSVSSPVEKEEPYNQTFSFSAASSMPSTSAMPSTSSFNMPSTSSYNIPSTSSYNIPSTSSYNMPSTSSYNMPSTSTQDMPSTSYEIPSMLSRGLLPCQPLSSNETDFGQGLAYSPVLQSPSISSAANKTPGKEPAVEKLVLRRVLQTDPKEPAERSHSVQGLKGVTKNRKDSSQTYFMVVKNKDRQQNLISARQQIRKQTNVDNQEKEKVEQKMKKVENHRSKLINKLFQELQSVKQKLDQCNLSKQEIERELLAVKADLEETKRTTDFQSEALMKQNAKFENEIQILKQRNESLTNSLEQAQIYRGLGNHAWNFADNHMSKQFQNIEEQKLELQRRIEELECESRELKNSSTIERGRFETKARQYFKIINELKRRLDAQTAKSEELQLQRDFYEKHLPPEICFQVKSQLAAFQHQGEVYEIFPGLLTPQPTPPIASPAIPLAETLLTDIQNINYITFQSQMSPESPEVFQQQQQQTHEGIRDEEVS